MSRRKDTRSRALEEKMELMLDKCLCLLFEAFEGHKKKTTSAHPSLLYLAKSDGLMWLIRQIWCEGMGSVKEPAGLSVRVQLDLQLLELHATIIKWGI